VVRVNLTSFSVPRVDIPALLYMFYSIQCPSLRIYRGEVKEEMEAPEMLLGRERCTWRLVKKEEAAGIRCENDMGSY